MHHICHISTGHTAFDTRIFKRECVSLAQAGFKVSLIVQHDKEEVVDGVHLIPLRKYQGFFDEKINAPKDAVRIAKALKADLYHFHDPELVPWMSRLAQKISQPVIWDAHEDYVSTISHFNKFKVSHLSKAVAHFFGYLEKKACMEKFAGVVTVTPTMAERYEAWGSKTCVLENVPDLSNIKRPSREQRSDVPLFVSTGYQFRDRGVYEMATMFRSLREKKKIRIAYWGSFESDELKRELRERSAKSEWEPDVLIEGPLPWKRLVNDLLPTAWASFVLFNTADRNNCVGLPNRFFESWAACVPVIATAGTEVAKIVEAKKGGLVVDSNDPRLLEEAVSRFLAEPNLSYELGQNARQAVDEEFNWSLKFERLVRLYASLGIASQSKTSRLG